jgi:hypothetical protein
MFRLLFEEAIWVRCYEVGILCKGSDGLFRGLVVVFPSVKHQLLQQSDNDYGKPTRTFLEFSTRIFKVDMYSSNPSILTTSVIVPFTNLTAAVLGRTNLLRS